MIISKHNMLPRIVGYPEVCLCLAWSTRASPF